MLRKLLFSVVVRIVAYAIIVASSVVAFQLLNGAGAPSVEQVREALATVENAMRALENYR